MLYVNTGTSANSGNGDSIRTAFNKINQNFITLEGGGSIVTNVAANSTGTVVFSTTSTARCVKLLLEIESLVAGFTEVQAAELLVVRSNTNGGSSSSVLGDICTASTPLVSIVDNVNSTTGELEVKVFPLGVSSSTHVVRAKSIFVAP